MEKFQGIYLDRRYVSSGNNIYKLVLSNNIIDTIYLDLLVFDSGRWKLYGFFKSSCSIDMLVLHNNFKRLGLNPEQRS